MPYLLANLITTHDSFMSCDINIFLHLNPKQEDINVIIVGWGDGADSWLWNYDKSAANTRVAAKETALVIENLVANGGVDPMLLWCVGHSLGAHLCGHVGMLTHVHRVTGENILKYL